GDFTELKTELGDLLFQVIFYAQLAAEQKLFDFEDVISALNDKLVRRHPHVFASNSELSEQQVAQQWQAIKAQERATKNLG
ncbi:MazG nucleotide pyrophosphohydrolase domain-containing protein, partial [Streptomyces scabiei]|uniref:MazG nucleotide pyrophosphohydrolase domain-containing protein n=2 Tax=Bacteria TaxID=2 RepID=UPI0038F68B1E